MFQPIDLETWPRREYYHHYMSQTPCSYSMTVDLEVTQVKRRNLEFYPAMLHALATVVNRHQEFRTALDSQGRLGVYRKLSPSYTVFHNRTQTFSQLWTDYAPDYRVFLARYHRDRELYGGIESLCPKPGRPENTFSVSAIPWQSFTSFHLELPRGGDYLLPAFTLGKYRRVGERLLLPLALQVHHAVCDGFHACRFVEELQEQVGR